MTTGSTGPSDGLTSLDEDELRGLRLTYIATRGELDAAEQGNIVAGRAWATGRVRTVDEILDDRFLRSLHREMFGDVWQWAGRYRQTRKNIGIDWPQIPKAVRNLCSDARVWCAAAPSASERDSAAVEFHHRLVFIHPFVHGNGRHARLAADIVVATMGGPVFTWGGQSAEMPTAAGDPVRSSYLNALRLADGGDLQPLVVFARS